MTTKRTVTALLTTTVALGYDWKMDGDKLAVDSDGNPVWIAPDAREMSVKGDTITSLNGEAKRHRERAERAEQSLAKYDGIDDPTKAREALETVSKLDAKQLIDAGKVDEVKAEITRQYEQRIKDATEAAAAATKRADDTLLDSAFNASEFARTRLAVPIEMVRATFGDRFKVEDGKIVARDANGNTIYSDKDMGAAASFDEALEKTISNYRHKDTILKAPEGGGSGNNGGGGNRGGGRTMSRADFEALEPTKQAEVAQKVGAREMTLTD